MSNNNKYNYYYLLYKINRSPLLWIVDESENYDELYEKIQYVFSTKENYYIVKNLYSKKELELLYNTYFKRFKIYNMDENSKLVFKTI